MKLEQMRLFLNDDRLESPLEDVTRAGVPAIEVLGVPSIQGMHPARKRWQRGLDQEMEVVSHQAVRVKEPLLVGDGQSKKVQEMAAIRSVPEDRTAFVAAAGDVVQSTRELQAKRS